MSALPKVAQQGSGRAGIGCATVSFFRQTKRAYTANDSVIFFLSLSPGLRNLWPAFLTGTSQPYPIPKRRANTQHPFTPSQMLALCWGLGCNGDGPCPRKGHCVWVLHCDVSCDRHMQEGDRSEEVVRVSRAKASGKSVPSRGRV